MEKRTYIIKKASIPVAVQRITWSFESNRSRLIVETMDNELNLQAKERVNLNALKRIENPHHETPLPLYSINDGCKTAFPTIISEEMVVFGNHVSTFFLPLFYVPGKDNRLFAQDTSELVYFAYVTNAIKRIFSLNENYQLARAAHERLQEYLCMPLSTDGGLTTLEILSIEYKAVGFSFGGRFQLSNINLAFRKGTLYGLCGKNGSGKTTLMLLLLGIYPNYRGEILINGINQKQYNLKKLRSCVIHYTEQTPVFFDEPMVKNFELFEGERRPFLQVKTYIQMLGLHNIVSLEDDALRFSEHYQYSAGELAKIAILRSLVLKKSVYIWDEPDTALDEAAKQALIKILKELSNEAIVVIITHNSDLLNACETIYHL